MRRFFANKCFDFARLLAGRTNLSPKKGENQEISCLKSSQQGCRLLLEGVKMILKNGF
jgi:hypothetical protein